MLHTNIPILHYLYKYFTLLIFHQNANYESRVQQQEIKTKYI